jgi:hypothetical protein|tara:strand:+ start:424 stop:600 length:177 start_codon:yes stop_codon:yes gene_type:complete
MLDVLNSIILFPYSIGKYIFSVAAYWFGINYALQSDAFIAFTEYCEQRWNDWVKKKGN